MRHLGAFLLGLASCKGCEQSPPAPLDAGTTVADAAPSPSSWPSAWAWERAAAGDPIARLRLGEDLGAVELLDLARGNGPEAEIALAALADAPDAPRVLAELARFAHRDAARRDAALRACLVIAERRPRDTEAEPTVVAEAQQALSAVASDTSLPPPSRNLAVSAVRALQRASGSEPW